TSSANLLLRRARGLASAPLAIQTGDALGAINFQGHGATGWSASRARILTSSTENWSDTAQGARLSFYTTERGTTATSFRMMIQDNGNVGIGSTNPQEKLQVDGVIQAGSANSPTSSIMMVDNYSAGQGHLTNYGTERSSGGPVIGYGVIPSPSAIGEFLSSYGMGLSRSAINMSSDIRFYTGALQTQAIGSPVVMSEAMRILNDGNVGIGTIAPKTKLHLKGNAVSSFLPLLTLNNSSVTGVGNSVMTITSTGKVGIGTTAPSSKLVVSVGNVDGAEIKSTNSPYVRLSSSSASTNSRNWALATNYSDDGLFEILSSSTNVTDATNSVLAITKDGSVGIGTNAPERALHIVGNGDVRDDIILESVNNANVNSGLLGFLRARGTPEVKESPLEGDVLGEFGFRGWRGTSYFQAAAIQAKVTSDFSTSAGAEIRFSTTHGGAYSEKMKISSNGNVGIGTATPTERLHVVGNILATGSINPSDIRLKKNFTPVESSLEKINTLSSVTYDWKDTEKYGEKRQMGVIAQEVEKVFPEAVTKTNDGFLAVSYTSLISPLIAAVKELYNMVTRIFDQQEEMSRSISSKADQVEIDELRYQNEKLVEENKKMQKENEEMKARLEKIEKALNL
ncbi:MAG: tail fiber domain-containing protein, partial [Bacteriovoracaceae bacterium]